MLITMLITNVDNSVDKKKPREKGVNSWLIRTW